MAADKRLDLSTAGVLFKDGSTTIARIEGNNAAWHCICGESLPLVGRCYFQFGMLCHTVCPTCNRKYRVLPDERKRARAVEEI